MMYCLQAAKDVKKCIWIGSPLAFGYVNLDVAVGIFDHVVWRDSFKHESLACVQVAYRTCHKLPAAIVGSHGTEHLCSPA